MSGIRPVAPGFPQAAHAAALVFLLFLQNPAAPPRPRLRVSIDMAPPVWMEGDALRLRLVVDNQGEGDIKIPKDWARGSGLVARQTVAPTETSQPRAVEVACSPTADMYEIPAGSRLVIPVEVKSFAPPPGDAFELFFLSSSPAAGSEALRVERVEDLRGARAEIDTQKGMVVFELAPESAPLAVRNFVKLAEKGFYDGIAFHRIARGLCIQAGDPGSKTGDIKILPGTGGSTFDGRALPLERTRVAFDRGTVGIARNHDEFYQQLRTAFLNYYKCDNEESLDRKLRADWPSAYQLQENSRALTSGSSQFFICTTNSPQFTSRYSAFAKVVEGMPVVDAIEASETMGGKASSALLAERPVEPVRIRKITIVRKPHTASAPAK
jgi:peptidyl-prolyl cis-trans isomerase B (cyclophilin B)